MAMKTYKATREKVFTMDATITCDSETYAKITTATFSDKGSITIASTSTTYEIRRKKPIHGTLFLFDAENNPIGRAWRGGILTKSMSIVLDGVLYRMDAQGFLKTAFDFYRVCDISFPIDDEGTEAKDFVKQQKKVAGIKVGSLQKDGLFKKTYSMQFADDLPHILPAFSLWLSTFFDRQDSAVAGNAGTSGAGAF